MFVFGSSSEFRIVGLSVHFDFALSIAIGSECHGTSFCSVGETSRIMPSTKDLSRSMLPAKFGAIPNQTWKLKSPGQRCNGLNLSISNGFYIAVRTVESLFCFIPFLYLSGIKEEQIS